MSGTRVQSPRSATEAPSGTPSAIWLRFLPAAAVIIAVFLVYVPDIGHGFLKDDFRWVLESRAHSPRGLLRLFSQDNGFFRPIVSLSFAVNEWFSGARPAGYAWTNFLLYVGCALGVAVLARKTGLGSGAALWAAAVWSLNPHGMSSLLLWISGRTASLLTLMAILTATAFLSGRRGLASLLALLAMLSKEEAVLLPVILLAWAVLLAEPGPGRLRGAVLRVWPLFVPLLPYFALRSGTQAYLPMDAPVYYRFTGEALVLGRNVLEYADRAATLTVALCLATALIVGALPRLDREERQRVLMGLAWAVVGFGLTVFLPVRSSLYACFPAVGIVLAGATCVEALWRRASERRRRALLVAACVVPLVLVPILRSRNVRAVRAARLSTEALNEIVGALAVLPPEGRLVIDDGPGRPNLRGAFGTLVAEALTLRTGELWIVGYEPSPDSWGRLEVSAAENPTGPSRHLTLREGRLVPTVPASAPETSP